MQLSIKQNNIELVSENLERNQNRNDSHFEGRFKTDIPYSEWDVVAKLENREALRIPIEHDAANFDGKINGKKYSIYIVVIPNSNNEYKYRFTVFYPSEVSR